MRWLAVGALVIATLATAGCQGTPVTNADLAPVPSTPIRWRLDPGCAALPGEARDTYEIRCKDASTQDFISVALSGGGTKAAIFSAESMFYLQAMGLLQRTSVISSVSGGSFAGAYYAISCNPGDTVCASDHPHGLMRPSWEHTNALSKMGQGYSKVVDEQFARLFIPIVGATVTPNRFADVIDSDYFGGGPGDGGRFLMRDIYPSRPNLFLNATVTSEDRGGLETDASPGCPALAHSGHLRRRTPDEFYHFAFTNYYFGLLRSRADDYPLAAGVAASAAFPALITNAELVDHCAKDKANIIKLMDGGANDNQALIEIYMVLTELVYGQHRSDLSNQPDLLETLHPNDRAWVFVVNSSVTEATGESGRGGGQQPRDDVGFLTGLVSRVLDATDVYSAEGYNLRKQLYLAERARLSKLNGFAPIIPKEISLTELDQYRLGGTEAALRWKADFADAHPDTDLGNARAASQRQAQRRAYDSVVENSEVRHDLKLSNDTPQCYFDMRAQLDASLISISEDNQDCLRQAARWAAALRGQELCDLAGQPGASLSPPAGLTCRNGRLHLSDAGVLGAQGDLKGSCKPKYTAIPDVVPAGFDEADRRSLACRHLE